MPGCWAAAAYLAVAGCSVFDEGDDLCTARCYTVAVSNPPVASGVIEGMLHQRELWDRSVGQSDSPDPLAEYAKVGGYLFVPAVIADVDGTLCNVDSVRHHVLQEVKDFDAFHAGSIDCPPHEQAIDWCVKFHEQGYRILVVTGRMDRWFDLTSEWLQRELPVPFDGPFMRRDGDRRSDVVVKKEILRYLRRFYDIRAAIDDNPSIVGLWKQSGIPVTVVPGWDDQHPQAPR